MIVNDLLTNFSCVLNDFFDIIFAQTFPIFFYERIQTFQVFWTLILDSFFHIANILTLKTFSDTPTSPSITLIWIQSKNCYWLCEKKTSPRSKSKKPEKSGFSHKKKIGKVWAKIISKKYIQHTRKICQQVINNHGSNRFK